MPIRPGGWEDNPYGYDFTTDPYADRRSNWTWNPRTEPDDICNPKSPTYDAELCKLMQTDWWSMPPEKYQGARSKYEELLDIARGRYIQDPLQQAQGAATSSPAASALWGSVYGKGVPRIEDIMRQLGELSSDPGLGSDPGISGKFNYLQQLANMISQNQQAYSGAMGQAYGQSVGPATSLVQGEGGMLQGYRGQDQQRYLTEKGWEHDMDMLIAQLKAQAAAQGGAGIWDILTGLAGLINPLSGLFDNEDDDNRRWY
jgi:hypothetical protein